MFLLFPEQNITVMIYKLIFRRNNVKVVIYEIH